MFVCLKSCHDCFCVWRALTFQPHTRCMRANVLVSSSQIRATLWFIQHLLGGRYCARVPGMDNRTCWTRSLYCEGQMSVFKNKDKSGCGKCCKEQNQIMKRIGMEEVLSEEITNVQKFKEARLPTGSLQHWNSRQRQRESKCKGPEVGKGQYLRIRTSPSVAWLWWM